MKEEEETEVNPPTVSTLTVADDNQLEDDEVEDKPRPPGGYFALGILTAINLYVI
jgi:hypothetical protein